MRLFFVVIVGMMFFSGRSLAQEDNIATATSALQDVLSTLKESVEKLSLDNDQLSTRDNTMKQQVLQLQMKLGQLEAQGDGLNKTADQLRAQNPRLAQQITRLETENFDLDDRTEKAEGSIKLTQQSLNAEYQEDQQLLLRLKKLASLPPPPPVPPSPGSQAEAHREKERLKLMKMIYDSQQRQESLHEAILDFQKNTPLLPGATAMAHQQLLKEEIKDLGGQISSYPSEKSSGSFGSNQWDATQLSQLELELKDLEQNYLQFKDLMGQMDKKAQATQLTVSQRVEADKLQGSVNDLNRQSVGLRGDLDDLRSQMVDLDKRKSHLESMVPH